MRTSVKSLLQLAGNVLAIAGIGFVGMKVWAYAGEIDLARLTPSLWCVIASLAIAYGCANLLLAFGWQSILAHLGGQEDTYWCIRTYGLSQIAKYVPGNIFQFAGRQAIGMSHGISGWILARSSIWELALLCISGSLFIVLVLPAFYAGISVIWAHALFILLTLSSVFFISKVFGIYAAKAHLSYVIFLTISGSIFVGINILLNINTADNYNFTFLAGAFVIAWLAGLAIPGAPAGVGVREAVVAIILNDAVPMQDIIIAVILGRLVTISGDILFFITASCLKKKR
jgi:hypothetical protein